MVSLVGYAMVIAYKDIHGVFINDSCYTIAMPLKLPQVEAP